MQVFGLIGRGLSHSFSREFFSQKFTTEGISAVYNNFDMPEIRQIKNLVKEIPNLKGLNITSPYKETVLPYLDWIDDSAQRVGAVNVIKLEKGLLGKRRLLGYNTDVLGFRESLRPLLDDYHRKALILGTGGASKAVLLGLKQLGLGCTLVSRKTHAEGSIISYGSLNEKIMREYTVIVNATPVGLYPNLTDSPDIPYEYLSEKHLLYDLIYNPETTQFLKNGAERGVANCKNGLEMLLLQAREAWNIWTAK